MTNHQNRKQRHYYAAQHPRGFGNEIDMYRFATKQDRDDWVDACTTSDFKSQRFAIKAFTARKWCLERGDAATEVYHTLSDVRPSSGPIHFDDCWQYTPLHIPTIFA